METVKGTGSNRLKVRNSRKDNEREGSGQAMQRICFHMSKVPARHYEQLSALKTQRSNVPRVHHALAEKGKKAAEKEKGQRSWVRRCVQTMLEGSFQTGSWEREN